MSAKLKSVFVFLIIAALFTCNSCQKNATPQGKAIAAPGRHELRVEKDKNGVWKVVRSDGMKDTLKVHGNEQIFWYVYGTDAYFQFPVEEAKVFNKSESDSLAGGYTTVIRDGKHLHLKIKSDPEQGPIVYAIFCMADSVFAIQDTPPIVVVE